MPTTERICPVCMELGMIGYGKKTCCSECGRAWVKMSKTEQQLRVKQANKTPDERANELLRSMDIVESEVPSVEEFDRRKVDPSLIMPSGLSEALGITQPNPIPSDKQTDLSENKDKDKD